MNVYEMEGFLRGKCLPGDLKVNESNAEYLVRKLNVASGLKGELTAALATIEKCREIVGCPAGVNLQDHLRQLAAENVVRHEFVKICFRAAADGASLDGADIQEIGERLGLFGRETYQPVLHGYICGHEAGEDSVYVMKRLPSTDRIVAGIKADGVEEMASVCRGYANEEGCSVNMKCSYNLTAERAESYAAYIRRQLREGASE